MPSTATITAFYTFTQNTKARASQVNNNFDVLRGHIIPIDPNTTTSNDITYDLGSDEHRWRSGYVKTLDFDRSTSTASATIEADANTNTGEIVFKLDGVEKIRINNTGIAKAVNLAGTATAAGGIATSAPVSVTITSAGAPWVLVGQTLTLVCTGKPVQIGFNGQNSMIQIQSHTTTSTDVQINVYRDGTSTSVANFRFVGSNNDDKVWPLTPIMRYDFSCTAGTHTYVCYAKHFYGLTSTNATCVMTATSLMISEI